MISITIDSRQIQVTPNTTVLEAALAHGIDIPRLCYHPELVPSGGCRLCLVEVEGRPNPSPSCGLACQEGMVVHTQTEALETMRRDIIDLFVSDHPLNCVICDKNGACDLQKYAYRYNISRTSFDFELSRPLYQDDNPFFVRDHQYCILCGKCVRVCDEVVGANAIDYANRGFVSYIATPFDVPLAESSCVFCGSCVQVCPTAALLPRQRIGKGREWELERKRTICGYCGVGCELEFALTPAQLPPPSLPLRGGGAKASPPAGGGERGRVLHQPTCPPLNLPEGGARTYAEQEGRDGGQKILYVQGHPGAPVNGEFTCVKGRFGWDFVGNPDRLTQPLIRKDVAYTLGLSDEPWTLPDQTVLKGKGRLEDFVPVSWDTAADIVAGRLAGIIRESGPDAVASLTSARCTNEENYLFQKMMRVAVGTNTIDHCARL